MKASTSSVRATVLLSGILLTLPFAAANPSTTLWYQQPAKEWQREALPIGNGRMGAMIFGGIGHERIALNEESVWSGSRVEWNRENASENLPQIRKLLLEGKNDEAEALVNQTFTCTGGGSRGGARGPWGCYQELGNLKIDWAAAIKPFALQQWKLSIIDTGGIQDPRERHQEVTRQVAEAIKPECDDSKWLDYGIDGKQAVKGARNLVNGDVVMLRHAFELTPQQVGELGTLRIDARARNGHVFVNGQKVGDLAGWQSSEHEVFTADIGKLLKPGKNAITIQCSNYRQRGQLPVAVSLEQREDCPDYRRTLDLADAISTVEYTRGGITYKREAFASAADQLMVFRFTSNKPKSISFTAGLDRLVNFETKPDAAHLGILMTGHTLSGKPDVAGVNFVARLRALHTGGKVDVRGNQLVVDSADEVILLVAAATDYQGFAGRNTPDPLAATSADIEKAVKKSYAQLRADSIADHRSYFDRSSLTLGDGADASAKSAALPTDQRVAAFAKNEPDPALAALYFNYGRYLMISSSRPGTMPANLQGIWAEGIQTPWNCDYHLDINVQMNYWPAEVTGLGDCHTPLFKLIESLQEPGAKTAKTYYNAKGWVAHVITNVWGFTAPGEQAGWGATATGTPWLCDHLWEHYDYNRDKEFLKWAYPIMKGSAEFFLDMLITDPKTGYLVTAPTNSPENSLKMANGKSARVCMGPTMDNQLLRELFSNCIRSAEALGIDAEFRQRLAETSKKLPPNQIGKHGQLMEWLEDYEEVEINHRHVSHLYALHPYNEITPDGTPELAKAAKVTLERRGDKSTGWSMAWKSNFWARLHDGDHAHSLLKLLITGGGSNLLCQHAPFQIDGNFGGTAAVAEMILQCHSGTIHLLPALPKAWPHGKITGWRARGGHHVDMEWKDGKVTTYTIRSKEASEVKVRIGSETKTIRTQKL